MEGQGKRLLLAVGLALGVMLLWNMIFPGEKPPEQPKDGSGSAAAVSKLQPAKSKVCVPKLPAGSKPVDMKPAAEAPDEIITRSYPGKLVAKFSSNGGSLVSWVLDDPRYAKDATKGELLPPQRNAGAFRVGFWDDKYGASTKCLPEQQTWTFDKSQSTDTTIVYTYKYENIELTKAFTLYPDAFLIRMRLTMKVNVEGDAKFIQRLAVTSYAYQDPTVDTDGKMQVSPRVWNSATFHDGTTTSTTLKELQDGPTGTAEPRTEPNITWTGFDHPYLQASYAPKPLGTELIAKHTYPLEPYGLMRTDIEVAAPGDTFSAASPTVTREFAAYLGPKNYNQLNDADDITAKEKLADGKEWETHFKATIDLGWFAFIGRPLMWLLFKFQNVVVNWGLAIMLLTILVKGLTLFWTTKSMRSMKAMAALAPQMKLLQEKYKNDKQRIQAETMALYKQHGVNPIAGCLPIVLQMPIWIALYRMLSNAGELYQQPFITGWIDDLTNTDPYHILPVVLLVTMFAQARLSPQTGNSTQQKFLQYGMPLMFGVMAFVFPSGLTLYIFTNTCLSALHSIYMNKYDKKSLEIMARMKKATEEAAAKAAGTDKKSDKKAEKKPADKKVIDAESTERSDESDDASDSAATSGPSKPAQNRPRKKKRRR
jgi:YidC/Oxa1 family membrane protein insertase